MELATFVATLIGALSTAALGLVVFQAIPPYPALQRSARSAISRAPWQDSVLTIRTS